MMYESPAPKRGITGWAKRRTPSSLQNSNGKKKTALFSPPSCPPSTGMSLSSTLSNASSDSWNSPPPLPTSKQQQQQNNNNIQVAQYIPKVIVVLLVLLICNAFFLFNELPPDVRFNPRMSLYKHPNYSIISFQENGGASSRKNRNNNQNKLNENQKLSKTTTAFSTAGVDERYARKLKEMEKRIAQSTGLSVNERVRSCRLINCTKGTKYIYFNEFFKPRILCGTTIDANGTLVIDNSNPCFAQPSLQSSLLPALPTRQHQQNSSLGIPPVRLCIKGVRPSKSFWLPFKNCDVNCYQLNNNLNMNAITRTIQGTNWEIITSMEGPQYYHSIAGRNDQRPDNLFYASTSLDSEIPMAYFSWDEYGDRPVAGNRYEDVEKAAVYMARNCQSKNRREELVQNLMEFSQKNSSLRVDSISTCLHNHDPPSGLSNKDDKNEILGRYMFYLAFENQCVNDYITEKLWGSLFRSGAIPIYYGSPNIEEHVPPNSLINAHKFPNAKALWKHLVEVSNNRTVYDSYHAWRQHPLPESFVRKYIFTHTHSLCRMCRWAFAKQYGYGWNHEQQTVEEELVLSQRKLCWDKSSGLLTKPFRETWLSAAFQDFGIDANHAMCSDQDHQGCNASLPLNEVCDEVGAATPRSITIANKAFRRTVWSHDGVLDLKLEQLSQERRSGMVLKLQSPFLKDVDEHLDWNHVNNRHFWVQGKSFRMTIITTQDIGLASPTTGIIQMFVTLKQSQGRQRTLLIDGSFRMRVIVEHIDEMTQKSKVAKAQQTSYFSKLMVDDFLNPIEKFIVLDGRGDTSDLL